MNGNFTRLNRQHGGQELEVEGWLDWEEGDTGATLRITITQGTLTATADPEPVTPDDTTWKVTVTANGAQFAQGVAAGLAGATVQSSGGNSDQSWISGPLQVH